MPAEPATDVTPVLVNVTAPVEAETEMPVPPVAEPTTETAPVLPFTDVTPVLLIVTPPVEADTEMAVPPVTLVTPVLVIVTAPVPADRDMPPPAAALVTPVFVIVGLPDTPSPFDTDMPVLPVRVRVVYVLAAVRAIIPVVLRPASAANSVL